MIHPPRHYDFRQATPQALRGVRFTVALSTVAELWDLSRFDSRRPMAFREHLTSSYRIGDSTWVRNGYCFVGRAGR
jgi:hypothetical protein